MALPGDRRRFAACRVAPALLLAALATAPAGRAFAVTTTPVRVEAVRPRIEKHPTLRFLRDNRAFLRAALDRTREKPLARSGGAEPVDPRFLAYQEMLARIAADRDTVAGSNEATRGRELLRSVTELGALEAQLDQMERLLGEQRGRLGVLQKDFTGDQKTALAVVVSGYPADAPVDSITLVFEDGTQRSIPLTRDEQEALRGGGILQVLHSFVEPREQVVQVSLAGGRWPAGDAGFLTLDPERDRLTLLRLDLSAVHANPGAAAIQATTWLLDDRTP